MQGDKVARVRRWNPHSKWITVCRACANQYAARMAESDESRRAAHEHAKYHAKRLGEDA